MGVDTGISWTTSTFNSWWGCSRVSPGCVHCYAETIDEKYERGSHWGPGAKRRTMSAAYWAKPVLWDKRARESGEVHRVFCGSMCDFMDPEAPPGEREKLWDLIERTPNLVWQLLTKRPQNFGLFVPKKWLNGGMPKHIWWGVSAENQHYYDLRMEMLRRHPAHVRFVSYEPALGPVTMKDAIKLPDWLICGGESGPGFRPIEEQWARDIKAECNERGVKFFMKQMSALKSAKAAELVPLELYSHEFPA